MAIKKECLHGIQKTPRMSPSVSNMPSLHEVVCWYGKMCIIMTCDVALLHKLASTVNVTGWKHQVYAIRPNGGMDICWHDMTWQDLWLKIFLNFSVAEITLFPQIWTKWKRSKWHLSCHVIVVDIPPFVKCPVITRNTFSQIISHYCS